MFKRFLSLLVAVIVCGTAFAEEFSLQGETRVAMRINWSEAVIGAGYTAETILSYEQDWNKDQPVLLDKLVSKYNSQLGYELPAVKNVVANYTIELRPLMVNDKGDMSCYAVVLDSQGQEVYRIKQFKAEGGHCGTFLNLVGDGMKSAGKKLAKLVKKELL
ncbi:MAG: hypothetical protein K6E86_10225 [Bacteroidales bacterium]|nr:hypothetical protein [Bacteroidales bacterium]